MRYLLWYLCCWNFFGIPRINSTPTFPHQHHFPLTCLHLHCLFIFRAIVGITVCYCRFCLWTNNCIAGVKLAPGGLRLELSVCDTAEWHVTIKRCSVGSETSPAVGDCNAVAAKLRGEISRRESDFVWSEMTNPAIARETLGLEIKHFVIDKNSVGIKLKTMQISQVQRVPSGWRSALKDWNITITTKTTKGLPNGDSPC